VARYFICRAHPGHQIDGLRAEGYGVSALPASPVREAADGDYTAWLGWLRVVISDADGSPICVTAFFDRRLRKSR